MKRKKRTGTRPNVEELLEPLKGFQRNTVEYVFERMYKAKQPATRFLVADEVGLGKTMIARGIIAKAIDDMWDRVGRIDIVYICSNVAIAKQNLQKLVVGEAANHALATRLTLLPRNLEGLDTHKLNFVSFTPGTSFDLKSRGGMVSERVVLHTLLSGVMDPTAGVRNLLQGNVEQSTWLRELRREAEVDLDPTLAKAFRKAYRDKSQQDLRRRLREAIDMFGRYRDKWPREHRRVRNRIIGDLRMLLARTSVEKLEPDLIILDEFQRFRHLLRGSNEMASLARSMWNYVTPEGDRARVLLLSATPYRMYSTDFENAEDDHYRDFIDTTRFLMNDDEGRVRPFVADLRRYRNAIHAALHGDTNKIVAARDAVQGRLRDVMVRTERVAETTNRDAMMMETRTPAELQASDLQQWVFLDKLSRELNDRDPIELWKSAPYLPQFMRSYELKRKLEKRLEDPVVAKLFEEHREALLDQRMIRKFGAVDPANARLRAVMRDLLSQDQWQLLWVPPTLPYWPLEEAFAHNGRFTKALIFSAWHVVPDVVSAVLSYEADRLMLGGKLDAGLTYKNLHEKHRGLLRFSISEGRNTGMPTLALQYPSLTLADEACPLSMWAVGEDDRRAAVRGRVARLLEEFEDPGGRVDDERWYWAAPALLDHRRGLGEDFLGQWSLEQPENRDREQQLDMEGAAGDDRGFSAHVALLRALLGGEHKLGRKPSNLVEVVTELALGAPGVLAARSLRPTNASASVRQRAAALVAEGFRTLFNQPTAMAVVQRLAPELPYWRACLRYAIAGCLQAVLDEHFHQQWEQRVWTKTSGDEAALSVAKSMGYAASIKSSRIQADTFKATAGTVEVDKLHLRTSFALRYGKAVGDEHSVVAREGAVREAFNSPYRPFVLASTSIGQEGLDFHPWCHAIVHWNLPGNPVDLEQREGRVHRYEGHAVRRNVAARFGKRAVREWTAGEDLWQVMFGLAANERAAGESDLQPWWIFEGESSVERRVPLIGFSKEVERLERLKRELVAYRLAFGQPRQQELVSAVVEGGVGIEEIDGWVLNLRP